MFYGLSFVSATNQLVVTGNQEGHRGLRKGVPRQLHGKVRPQRVGGEVQSEELVKIVIVKEDAFVDLGNGYCMFIGTKAEVEHATPTEVAHMIHEALAYNEYKSIPREGERVH